MSDRDYSAERRLPDGLTCADCRHGPRCDALFGAVRKSFTSCDFWPSRFSLAVQTHSEEGSMTRDSTPAPSPSIPAGMVAYGPEHPDYPNAPSDWDGGKIMLRHGLIDDAEEDSWRTGTAIDNWKPNPYDAAAYTPKPQPSPAREGEAVHHALDALESERRKPLQGPEHGAWDRGRRAGLDEAIRIVRPFAALAKPPAPDADVVREALERLEAANETVAAGRSQAVYLAMIDEGQEDALSALDDARRNARAALSALQEGE